MAALPKDLQLDLLAEFQFLPGDLESLEDEKFGKVSRDGRSLLRYRRGITGFILRSIPRGF